MGYLIHNDAPLSAGEYVFLERIRPLDDGWGYNGSNSVQYRFGVSSDDYLANLGAPNAKKA
jgi:hypothetical protein